MITTGEWQGAARVGRSGGSGKQNRKLIDENTMLA